MDVVFARRQIRRIGMAFEQSCDKRSDITRVARSAQRLESFVYRLADQVRDGNAMLA